MKPASRHAKSREIHQCPNPAATRKLAQKLSKELLGGSLLLLTGPVGCGKTTFTQALAKALGVREPVRSPTFVLLKKYRSRRGKIVRLVHIDAYRLRTFQDIIALGLADDLGKPDTLVVIEWPKGKAADWPKIPTYVLAFTQTGPNSRKIKLLRPGYQK